VSDRPKVHLVTLGCARNEVDSDELAGRLLADGWELSAEAHEADVVLVNTCGFVEAAKSDSIATVLDLADTTTVVATGCMAERYGKQLAAELPEAAAVLGFDHYPVIGESLRTILNGGSVPSHTPRDRRTLLPVTPVLRGTSTAEVPGHQTATALGGAAQRILRHRLVGGPVAAVKIASGCDRRCAFSAIPSFRGAFVARPSADIIAEADALVAQGVVEVILVSENSTAYGKDLPGESLESLLGGLSRVAGLRRIRVSYLQPAEVRPSLLDAMAALPAVAPYYDLSFQHASGPLLRRMKRFGSAETFLELIEQVRRRQPEAGIRSNVIVGFPGETSEDFEVLQDFLNAARLDAVGVFGYSDEDGTQAADMDGKVHPDEISERVAAITELVDITGAERAGERVGSTVSLLVEHNGEPAAGRAELQGPEDGECLWAQPGPDVPIGSVVRVDVVGSDGADLLVRLGDAS
jgi:ribosomal protein S12 methylthiotransferase RimO